MPRLAETAVVPRSDELTFFDSNGFGHAWSGVRGRGSIVRSGPVRMVESTSFCPNWRGLQGDQGLGCDSLCPSCPIGGQGKLELPSNQASVTLKVMEPVNDFAPSHRLTPDGSPVGRTYWGLPVTTV